MATIYVDNQAYEVDGKQNLLHACLSLGFDLPYFCWHPALGSVGACRQCAVMQFRNADDTRGRLVMACLTPAANGTRISITDPAAVTFRAGVIEGLMLNHPHDCPVCDEGGECHLQDMTVMTGHDYRRYEGDKRTFRNQYLGPFVNHEMNRCIQCYRCVRFYREYAGGRDFNAFGLRNVVYFGRDADGVLENEFSGNLVEVCPTGVFTDATLKHHYTRKWDMQFAPSVCVNCGLGCNTHAAERYGLLRRIVNRYNGEVNRYFICDRGRFSYEFVNSERRIRQPVARRSGDAGALTAEAAVQAAGDLLGGTKSVIGIGSPRASVEANFALRTLVGSDRFFAGVADDSLARLSAMLAILRTTPARSPSLGEIEACDAVLVLGEDVTNVAPRMALSLRQSVRQRPMAATVDTFRIPHWLDHAVREAMQDAKGPLYVATVNATRLDDAATRTYRAAPAAIALLGYAVAAEIDGEAPAAAGVSEEVPALAREIAQALMNAKQPLLIAGESCLSLAVIEAAANIANALCRKGQPARLSFTTPECNSFGLAAMTGHGLGAAIEAAAAGLDALVILENDLFRRTSPAALEPLFAGARHVIVLDQLQNETTERATLLFPSGTFAESDGTLVSSEGRAQRFFQVFPPVRDVQESWRWLRDIAPAASPMREWQKLDDVTNACAAAIPQLAPITRAAPPSTLRLAGEKVPREPYRYSGRTAMFANLTVHEPKPPEDRDAAMTFSMEGYPDQPPAALIPFFWSPGWNSIQAVNKYQSEIAGPLHGGDPGVRLIEADPAAQPAYFPAPRAVAESRAGQWLLVPLYHIFGSEELSRYSPPVAELIPAPYIMLGAADATRLGLESGEQVEVLSGGVRRRLTLQIGPQLPAGLAGVPSGLVDLAVPAWATIARAS